MKVLSGYSPWDLKGSDTTECTQMHIHTHAKIHIHTHAWVLSEPHFHFHEFHFFLLSRRELGFFSMFLDFGEREIRE